MVQGTIKWYPSWKMWNKQQQDRRHFKNVTSKKKHFIGIWKLGTCMGSWICTNDYCSYYKTTKKHNELQWETYGDKKSCKMCGLWGGNIFCDAKKLVEFDVLHQVLTVLHLGTHICTLKPQAEDDAYLLDVTTSDMQWGPVALRRNEICNSSSWSFPDL